MRTTLSRREFHRLSLVALLAAGAIACSDKDEAAAAPKRLPEQPDDMVLGDPNAPIQMVEYASLTCSHCKAFHVGTATEPAVFPVLKANYIDTGKMRYVLREFPLDSFATSAFMLAHCAAREAGAQRTERYFAVVSLLFERHPQWLESAKSGDDVMNGLAQVMRETGMGKTQFDACLKDADLLKRINTVHDSAQSTYGRLSTPTFFINGVKHAGALQLDRFEAILDPLLPKP